MKWEDAPPWGAVGFGMVIGWLVYAIYFRAADPNIGWLTSLLGVIAGGTLAAVFKDKILFGAYCIGLTSGFFLRMILFSPLFTRIGQALGLS